MISKRATGSGSRGEAVKRLERLLTVDQLAELWQVSPRTVRRMIADGRLPVVRLGRAVRIPAKAAAP
jgi:excisionase family DNA binding protein